VSTPVDPSRPVIASRSEAARALVEWFMDPDRPDEHASVLIAARGAYLYSVRASDPDAALGPGSRG
jgi:hypothetical protein